MKKVLTYITFLIFAIYSLSAQSLYEAKVSSALNNSEWFELRDLYVEGKDSLPPMLKTFSESMLAYNFNRNDEACRAIDRLVNEHQTEIGVGNVMSMLYIKPLH